MIHLTDTFYRHQAQVEEPLQGAPAVVLAEPGAGAAQARRRRAVFAPHVPVRSPGDDVQTGEWAGVRVFTRIVYIIYVCDQLESSRAL